MLEEPTINDLLIALHKTTDPEKEFSNINIARRLINIWKASEEFSSEPQEELGGKTQMEILKEATLFHLPQGSSDNIAHPQKKADLAAQILASTTEKSLGQMSHLLRDFAMTATLALEADGYKGKAPVKVKTPKKLSWKQRREEEKARKEEAQKATQEKAMKLSVMLDNPEGWDAKAAASLILSVMLDKKNLTSKSRKSILKLINTRVLVGNKRAARQLGGGKDSALKTASALREIRLCPENLYARSQKATRMFGQ